MPDRWVSLHMNRICIYHFSDRFYWRTYPCLEIWLACMYSARFLVPVRTQYCT
jgi:hypothetical protein